MTLSDRVTKLWRTVNDNFQRKKTARLRIWHHFCDETPLQGFLIFRNSRFLYEKASWLLLVTLAITVTLYDSSKTIREFMKEEILSKVSLMRNDTINLPELYMAAELKLPNSFSTSSLLSKNESEMLKFLSINEKKILFYYSTVQWINNSFVNESDILLPILQLTVHLLEAAQDRGSDLYTSVDNSTTNYTTAVQDIPAIHLRHFFMRNGLHLGEVYKTTAMYLCRLINLEIERQLDRSTDSACRSYNTIALRSSFFAIRFPYALNFTAPADIIYIRARSALPGVEIIRLFFTFGVQELDYKENSFTVSNREQFNADVEIASIKHYSTSESVCTNVPASYNHLLCRQICRANYVRSRCGCTALQLFLLTNIDAEGDICYDWIHNNDSINQCSQKNCSRQVKNDREIGKSCESQCTQPCSHLHLRFSRSSLHDMTYDLKDNSTTIGLSVSTHYFVHTEQVLAMDAQTLMSNLGGNLGLYIGGTFLAIIHLTTSIVRLLVNFVVANSDEDGDQDVEMESTISDTEAMKAEMISMKESMARMVDDMRQLKGGSLELLTQ